MNYQKLFELTPFSREQEVSVGDSVEISFLKLHREFSKGSKLHIVVSRAVGKSVTLSDIRMSNRIYRNKRFTSDMEFSVLSSPSGDGVLEKILTFFKAQLSNEFKESGSHADFKNFSYDNEAGELLAVRIKFKQLEDRVNFFISFIAEVSPKRFKADYLENYPEFFK